MAWPASDEEFGRHIERFKPTPDATLWPERSHSVSPESKTAHFGIFVKDDDNITMFLLWMTRTGVDIDEAASASPSDIGTPFG